MVLNVARGLLVVPREVVPNVRRELEELPMPDMNSDDDAGDG